MTELVADAADPSENRPIEGPRGPRDWSKSLVPERRCTAHKKNGDRCKNAAIRGGTVCGYHGGNAPAVKAKARQRIEEAADRMARELLKMAIDDHVADSVKLAAIRDALDRAGLAAKTALEVEVGPKPPYEVILEGIEAGSRAEYRRRSQGMPDDSNADHTRPLAHGLRELPAAEAESIDSQIVDYQPHRGIRRHRPAEKEEGETL